MILIECVSDVNLTCCAVSQKHICLSRLVLLNKVLEDGNCLYRKGRLDEAEQRYRCGLRKVFLTWSSILFEAPSDINNMLAAWVEHI